MKNLKFHMDKAGILGVILSHMCCIGFGAKISLFSAIGAGFLTNHAVLLPIFIISFSISILGIFTGYLKHRNILPVILSVISFSTVCMFMFLIHVRMLVNIGVIGLIGASVYNYLCLRKCAEKKQYVYGD